MLFFVLLIHFIVIKIEIFFNHKNNILDIIWVVLGNIFPFLFFSFLQHN